MNAGPRPEGDAFARERAVAARVQAALERLYHLDRVASVEDFVRGAEGGDREALLLREAPGGDLEVTVRLPPLRADRQVSESVDLDDLCQIIEGVSHFVYLVERARTGRGTTQLELELQAEVDKWVMLAAWTRSFDATLSARIRERLYEGVTFVDEAGTDAGARYRIANDAAHAFVRRLERDYLGRARFRDLQDALRVFFHIGQEGKLRLGRAA